ncbi:MAG TPA: SUMF1/EgtB/PvdO family nonheme iron enzyme, partial [Oceanipulchritudo sp.]|nr:SUMF1/EgtB/PvdO family nonheme iron enzyme [Oceanipulchritudo sp.]
MSTRESGPGYPHARHFRCLLIVAILALAAAAASATERSWKLPQDLEMKLVWIEAGTFIMGTIPDDPDQIPDETPRHEVTLTEGFWIGACEVTQEQFASLMGYNPSHFQKGVAHLPV